MAVFRKTEQWGWMALPVRYREHPLLNLDLQHFEMIDVPMLDNVDEYGPDYVVQHSSPAADLPMPSTASLKKQRSKIVSLCQVMREWIFHCSNNGTLDHVEKELTSLTLMVRNATPRDGNFIIDNNRMTNIATKKHDNKKQRVASKNLQAKKRVKPLPVARRKRKGSGRVGSTAENIRRLHTNKGVEQLQSTNQDDHDSEIQLNQETVENICQTEDLSQRRKGLQVSFDDPIEKVRLFPKSSILNPSKRNILLNVGGYMINQQSLYDLDSELPDEVMNAYISSKTRQCKNRSVAFIPCATITSIFLEDIDSNDPFPSHGYLQQFAELILDDDENFKFDSTIRGIRALRHVIGQFLVENSESNEQASEESDISTVYEVYEVSSDNQSCCSKTPVNDGVEPLVGVASSEKMSLSSNWLYNAVFANTKITQRITSGMCGIMDDLPMTIQKGTASVNGKNLASLGSKELNALVLSTFGTWKQKFKLRVGCGHGYFLTVKDIENGELLERIESLMSQNLNHGYDYFMDVVFVEAEILVVSHLRGITITEADKLLYPVKKHNEQV
ncbi:Hypothetical predicted protein [Mytilus galloprovincialis]|uniref:Uncharacterized protein n=1 Tax=Mytilus galloprovincialis TaxID=29158 RepID=A0A8B6C338_MYTGA|nr:Hypothetical predicted protein [Mytilus galloprovincialis]